jgi:copper chaperone NosL
MRPVNSLAALLLVALALAGCGDKAPVEPPRPQELTRDAIGYFCNMTVVEHKGPKGQIFLSDQAQPLWFTSVRDTLAFTVLPGEPKNIAAIYVTDMGRASWDAPEPGTWIDARAAFYVLGSDRVGGMRAPEVVPFARKEDAQQFMRRHGGEIADFRSIPPASILEPGD